MVRPPQPPPYALGARLAWAPGRVQRHGVQAEGREMQTLFFLGCDRPCIGNRTSSGGIWARVPRPTRERGRLGCAQAYGSTIRGGRDRVGCALLSKIPLLPFNCCKRLWSPSPVDAPSPLSKPQPQPTQAQPNPSTTPTTLEHHRCYGHGPLSSVKYPEVRSMLAKSWEGLGWDSEVGKGAPRGPL